MILYRIQDLLFIEFLAWTGWDFPKSFAQQYKTMFQSYFQVPRLEDWQIEEAAWENDAQHG